MPTFSHLHVHTQYSLLDGAAGIKRLIKKAKADGMPAVAITDHGNMFGVFEFVAEAQKQGIKPIVGCEFYVVEDRFKKAFTREEKDKRYHQLLLAKNQTGYHNISKLCSIGFIDGLYSKWARIDKEILVQYKEGLIATTCCLGAEVPQAIMNQGEEAAEKIFKWWLDQFGEDYYVELQNHELPEQHMVNKVLLGFAAKYNVKVIATNDSHYVEQQDANAHDILLCINTGDLQSTPIATDERGGKGYRFGFPNNNFFFKTQAEMLKLFSHIPEALDNTNEIISKIETPKLQRDVLLPNFPIPEGFKSADDYLKFLTYEGAKVRYGELSNDLVERLEYELKVVRDMGFAGYFLVVQDFINEARKMGVRVGPGRGSAAGSAVAYCVGITDIDPIRYNLLFERFLNPERVSMPDIDTDFDDVGRQRVIDYVVQKYGRSQVAQIVTFGSMAAKSSIKDVARVMDLSLAEANQLSALVPRAIQGLDMSKATLNDIYENVPELKKRLGGNDLTAKCLKLAAELEGSVRNTGIHAAGIIIAPDDITKFIPVSTVKDSELYVTQYDGSVIEQAGMLKMDFLGLKTLSILRDACDIVKETHDQDIDLQKIPLDDAKTMELYQRGDTVGTFQFESDGMRKYLRELKPTDIEDLIAMNALYRPGPMDYIPSFCNRKHGVEKVEYAHPLLEPVLKNTYGIMVYQEQIMQCAQIIGGYTLGGADLLRRAMGKKDKDKMAKERVKFVKGAKELHNIPEAKANDIFDTMEKFAGYGFNRSHAAAYSVLAFQTAYLKANYPAEFMAAVLTHNSGNTEDLAFFLDECKRMGLKVLGPCVNESRLNFSVNEKNEIRFGLNAIKGLGENAVLGIINERAANGPYKSIFELPRRINGRAINRKNLEALVYAGAFDCIDNTHRAQYFATLPGENLNAIEKALKMANGGTNAAPMMASLFGEVETKSSGEDVKLPKVEPMSLLEQLHHEKETTGIYFSGHPLDEFRLEVKSYCNTDLSKIQQPRSGTFTFAGIVTQAAVRKTKRGADFTTFDLEDKTGSYNFKLFGERHMKLGHFAKVGSMLYVTAKYESSPFNPEQLELNIIGLQLLQDVKEQRLKKMVLKTSINAINDELIKRLVDLAKKYPGKYPLELEVTDAEEVAIKLASPQLTVAAESEVFKAFDKEADCDLVLQ